MSKHSVLTHSYSSISTMERTLQPVEKRGNNTEPPASKVMIRHVYLPLWVCGDRTKTEEWTLNLAPGIKPNKSTNMKLATWNVRTMCTGLNTDLDKIEDLRKTAVIDRELARLNVDIAALQETRLADSGSVTERDYTFYWQGLSAEERRLHGHTSGNIRASHLLKLTTKSGTAHIISAYAPTLDAADDRKDAFYEDLQKLIESIPKKDQIYLLGDFNARVGPDNQAWPLCLGQFGYGKVNENGQRLLEFCTYNNLCITNTYNGKDRHKVSWRHPASGHWHQRDFAIVRRKHINTVTSTRSHHSADCNTDHLLVMAKAKITTKRMHRAKPPKLSKINARNTRNPEMKQVFQSKFEEQSPNLDEEDVDKLKDIHL
ncbi:craniofacial development protein 2-like [Penaeus chinensis]|uniref:craniofacial development protein 2-like n=1 Tax=Penaeus chinensis TaxID=139456 RepID=UPI001FB7893F|nr:craniofacial development protein 2-like [Penaeus chinensis]